MDKKLKKKINTCYKKGTSQVDCAKMIDAMNLPLDEEDEAHDYIHEVYGQKQPTLNETEYCIENGCICWRKPIQNGYVTVPLCDFNCHIHEQIVKDDGQTKTKWFKIAGTTQHGDPLPVIDVLTKDFTSMKWVIDEWGTDAIIEPGQNIKERLSHQILKHAKKAPYRPVFTHTGWREVDGKHLYLTGGGAIGPDQKTIEQVNVELDPPLDKFTLLPPLGDPVEAFQVSRDFLDIGDMPVTLPIWTAMYMAPLTEFIDTSFTMWYTAPSGNFKSVITALALNHFGNFPNDKTLPSSWRSTTNNLGKILFLAKDIPFVIDDWHPGEDRADTQRLNRLASDIIRDQGNRMGRGRMAGNRSLEAGYIPRGFLISSGEQIPGGHSQTSRLIVVEIRKSDIDIDKLTEAQETGPRRYNMAMAHYVSWISRNWDTLSKELRAIWTAKRKEYFKNDQHARLASDIASLNTTLYTVIKFGKEIGVIDEADESFITDSGNEIFGRIVANQGAIVEEERPSNRFVEAVAALLAAGKLQFDSKDDDNPMQPPPGVTWVGWHDNNGTLFFRQKNIFPAVEKYYSDSNQHFGIKERALWKDLQQQRISIDHEGAKPTSKVDINGMSKSVIKIKRNIFEN